MAHILRCQLRPGHRLDDWHWLVCGQSFGRAGGLGYGSTLCSLWLMHLVAVDTTQEQWEKECSGTGNCAYLAYFPCIFPGFSPSGIRLNLVSPAAHIKHFLKVSVAPHRFLYQSRSWKPLAF